MKLINRSKILASSLVLALAASPALVLADDHQKPADRTAGQVLDDASITAAVKTKLLADERTKGFDINVDTVKGEVTLRGGADTVAASNAAVDIANATDGVVAVDNQLIVARSGSELRQEANRATASGEVREVAEETGDEIDDGWITSKVKTQLLADDDVSGLAIDVDTDDNVVSLKGSVPSATVRNEAIRIARETKGVVRVKADQLIVSVD